MSDKVLDFVLFFSNLFMVEGNSKSFVRTSFLQKMDIWFRIYKAFSFTTLFGATTKLFIFSDIWVIFFL